MKRVMQVMLAAATLSVVLALGTEVAGARNLGYDCTTGAGSVGGLGNGVPFTLSITTPNNVIYTFNFTYNGSNWSVTASIPPGGPTLTITAGTQNSQLSFTLSASNVIPGFPFAYVINDATANSGNFAKNGVGGGCPTSYPLNLPGKPLAAAQPFSKPGVPIAGLVGSPSREFGNPISASNNKADNTTGAIGAALVVLAGGSAIVIHRRRQALAA